MEIVDWVRNGLRKDGKTQTGLANALGRAPSAVTELLRGNRQIKAAEIPIIAAYLEETPPRDPLFFDLSVMGKIGACAEIDAGVEQVPPEGYYNIETIIPLPAGAIGFEVVGDSMWPRYDPGDVIVCLREGVPPIEIPDGEEAALRLDDGRRFLKRLLRSTPKGVFNLESHNAPPIRGVHVDWASEVVAIIRAAKWRHIGDTERRKIATRAMKKRVP